jgi:hypothetical protein
MSVGSDPSATVALPERGRIRGWSDARLVARQVGFEQLAFWLNPIGAVMTIAFSVIFLLLLGGTAKGTVASYGHIKLINYYVAGFCAYGVMAACFTILAITLVNRREMGLLKRLRLSPLPTWMLMSAVIVNYMIVATVGVVLLLVVGCVGYSANTPARWAPFVLVLLVGMVCFSALGVGITTVVPNGRRRPHREPDLLHSAVPVGPLVPDRARLGAGHVRQHLPDPPLHRRPGGVVYGPTGYDDVALEGPGGHVVVGRCQHRDRPASLELVAEAGLTSRVGCSVRRTQLSR